MDIGRVRQIQGWNTQQKNREHKDKERKKLICVFNDEVHVMSEREREGVR